MMHHHSFMRLSLLRLSRSSAIRSLSTATGAASTQSSDRVAAIAEEIANLTVLETSHLAELVRQRLGVEQMPQLAVISPGMSFPGGGAAMGQAAPAAGAEVKEEKEKTAFDVKLEGFDAATKIKVIKEVRAFTELGLKEAKELVEKAPIVVKAGITKEEANKIMEKLKEVGAKVVLE